MTKAKRTRKPKRRDARTEAIETTFVSLKVAMGTVVGRRRPGPKAGGLTFPQIGVLRFINYKGTTTPNEIAETFGVTPANITGLVSKLERAGLIKRVRDERDRRVVRLSPTPKARRGMELWRRHAVARLREAFADWRTDEILALKRMLDRLAPEGASKGPWGPPDKKPR